MYVTLVEIGYSVYAVRFVLVQQDWSYLSFHFDLRSTYLVLYALCPRK
jgi:hypothetical protein